MIGTFDDGRAYRVFLQSASSPPPGTAVEVEGEYRAVPSSYLMVGESRDSGWTLATIVEPRVHGTEDALQRVLGAGLAPGSGCIVRLEEVTGTETVEDGGNFVEREITRPVRTWPCVVTSVSAVESTVASEANCLVGLADLLTAHARRPVWFAWSVERHAVVDDAATAVQSHPEMNLAEVVGAALSAAIAIDSCADGAALPEDLYPSSYPKLPSGFYPVQVTADIDSSPEAGDQAPPLPYVIAAGQPLGTWLMQLCSYLGSRIELFSRNVSEYPYESLVIHITDKLPDQSALNFSSGAIRMHADYTTHPSRNHVMLTGISQTAIHPSRAGVLDTPSSGDPRAFGDSQVVGGVISDARVDIEEAERRHGFRAESDALAMFRIAGISCEYALTLGRTVQFTVPDADLTTPDGTPLREWQVALVSHLFVDGSYWNRAEFEASEPQWRPRLLSSPEPVFVSGWVDDGVSEPGEPVKRDRLGRLPVRLVFSDPLGEYSDRDYTPQLLLSPISLVAGKSHGYIADHRQQDWCRVQINSPLSAEVLGFAYRSDRSIKLPARDITAGMLVRQGSTDWSGLAFQNISGVADHDCEPGEDTSGR